MGLDRDSYHVVEAAFSGGDFESLRGEIGYLGEFPNVPPDAAIGMPLIYAIYHSPLALVRELLDAGADPNLSDGDGFPPLMAAIACTIPTRGASTRYDVLELVELLLSRGADVGLRGLSDYTPLHLAAENDDLPMVALLLRFGADPNQVTPRQRRTAASGPARVHKCVAQLASDLR